MTTETSPHLRSPETQVKLIEQARRELLLRSDEIRREKSRPLTQNLHLLSRYALFLMRSDAPRFEKLTTINEVQANLGALPNSSDTSLAIIARLSAQLLAEEFPVNQISSDMETELKVRQWAIEHTGPGRTFLQAFEEGWRLFGMPIDLLIEYTDGLVQQSRRITAHADKEVETTQATQFAEL